MRLFLPFLLFLLAATPAPAAEVAVGRFSAGDLSGWREETFRGKAKTAYLLVKEDGRTVLKAHSRHAASGLLRKVDLDPRKYPLLRWSWQIGHPLKKEDVRKKGGDDFAARVYVVFPRTFFWQTRAINYVWAGRLPKNSAAPSPYTANAVIIAVESGEEKEGSWVSEERNIYEDYKRAFGEEPPRIGAIAVMTDTDDTGEEVTAWYGDITLADR
ncbi:MAG: DUF3047 domain-containing protein [Geobacteraceae bacterium]|nr:DUF3047 domain-containing protein [Geobacteraceae bacterium]